MRSVVVVGGSNVDVVARPDARLMVATSNPGPFPAFYSRSSGHAAPAARPAG